MISKRNIKIYICYFVNSSAIRRVRVRVYVPRVRIIILVSAVHFENTLETYSMRSSLVRGTINIIMINYNIFVVLSVRIVYLRLLFL